MKKILIIATGGTISCSATDEGLRPKHTFEDLIAKIDYDDRRVELSGIQLMNIDSANIVPSNWEEMATTIRDNYDIYDGFVITHGTDTLSFTGAALSYLVQNSAKPIVLTASQYPLLEENTDAIDNLNISIDFACQDAKGVFIAFNNKIIIGTQARKIRSINKDAFISLNKNLAAVYEKDGLFANLTLMRHEAQEPKFYDRLSNKVALIKLYPGLDPDLLIHAAKNCDVLVIEAYGSGSIPFAADMNIEGAIEKLSDILVIVSTQMLHEGTHMERYEVGSKVLKFPHVIEGNNLSTECCITKAMWALPLSKNKEEFRALFNSSVHFDM